MRPKKTFRATDESGRTFSKSAAQFGISNPEDGDLDIDLANSLAMWRGKYQRFLDQAHNPPIGDVKATLRALADSSESVLDDLVRLLDPHSLALLKEAARLEYRRKNPDGAIPAGTAAIRQLDARTRKVVARHDVRELAAAALGIIPEYKGNPNKISGLDHLFAVALTTRWNTDHPDDPARVAIRDDEPTNFQDWAWQMFVRVGRRSNRADSRCLSDASLTRILGIAVQAVRART